MQGSVEIREKLALQGHGRRSFCYLRYQLGPIVARTAYLHADPVEHDLYLRAGTAACFVKGILGLRNGSLCPNQSHLVEHPADNFYLIPFIS